MRCKIFHGRSLHAIETAINEWLNDHVVSIEHTQFTTVYGEDSMEHVLFHTLILFYREM